MQGGLASPTKYKRKYNDGFTKFGGNTSLVEEDAGKNLLPSITKQEHHSSRKQDRPASHGKNSNQYHRNILVTTMFSAPQQPQQKQ
jgi:hypothetical protein